MRQQEAEEEEEEKEEEVDEEEAENSIEKETYLWEYVPILFFSSPFLLHQSWTSYVGYL